MPTKSVKKSGKKSGSDGKFASGPDPRRGRGPEKGAPNAGRPPNWLREWCDDLLASPECKAQVEKVLKNEKHAAFAQMWRTISERAHGKPAQAIDVTGNVTVTLRQLVLESMEGGR